MQCFAHSTEPAIGICKSCGKGVCRSCAIAVPRGLACSESCRPTAEGLSRWQDTAIRNVGMASAQRIVQPLVAIFFLGMGVYAYSSFGAGSLSWMSFGCGAIITLTTIFSWVQKGGRRDHDS
jgi:hypothetical protein